MQTVFIGEIRKKSNILSCNFTHYAGLKDAYYNVLTA